MLALVLAALVTAVSPAPRSAGEPPAPTIELYTMGVGPALVEKFGHAAICVRWSDPRRDTCYNYGTTDFSDPLGLGWGFLRGDSVFWVSTQRPSLMLRLYRMRDRSVWLQPLPLSADDARAVAAALAQDALPENRDYQYHHFHDNCSTRVRDILDEALGGALSADADESIDATYRDLSRRGFAGQGWLLWISDLVLGRAADRAPTLYEAMFLPEVLRAEVTRRLGVEPELVYERQGPPFPTDNPWSRPLFIGLSLLFALPVWLAWWLGRRERLGLALSLAPVIFLGAVVWAVAIISPLPEARFNEVLLVLFPGDLALLWLGEARRRQWARVRVALIAACSLAAAIGLLAQPLWAVAPLALLPLVPVALRREEAPADEPAPAVAAS